MNRPPQKILFEEKLRIDMSLDQLQLDAIRQDFSALFDRALLGVQKAGLDLDDVEFNRFLICRTTEKSEIRIPANSLSDAERMKNSIIQNIQSHDNNAQPCNIHVIGLVVEVIADQLL